MMSHSPNSSHNSMFTFNFDACNSYYGGTIVWACCVALCFTTGFPASVSILWVLLFGRSRPLTPNDVFTLNLATMDAIFLGYCLPGLLNHFLFYNVAVERTWNFLYPLNLCGRPLMMACVCLDCYMAVVHPITYRRRKSLAPRVAAAAVVWALTLVTATAYLLKNSLFQTSFILGPYFVTIGVMGFCDYFILRTLMKVERGSIHPQKQRALQTLVNSLVVTLISYLPPVLSYCVALPLNLDPEVFLCTISVPVCITSSLGSTVMSFICLHNLGKLGMPTCGSCRGNT